MSELRIRDDRGRFASDAEENAVMNAAFMGMCGLRPIPTPAPKPTANAGQPVPPGSGPDLPAEDESKVMNRALLLMAGGAPIDTR